MGGSGAWQRSGGGVPMCACACQREGVYWGGEQ